MGKLPNAISYIHTQRRPCLNSPFLQCDTGPAWCDPATCQKQFSGAGSSCASPSHSNSSVPPTSTTTTPSYVSAVPNIDVCGHAVGGVSCPGAGVPPGPHVPGYYYRCCSSDGHCGPKNNIESQDLYCGAETCQVGFGDCATNRTAPPLPSGRPKTVGMGETCGPIVNAKCGGGLCCSGSNYCGQSGALFPKCKNTHMRASRNKTKDKANHDPSTQAPPSTSAAPQTGASRSGATAPLTDAIPTLSHRQPFTMISEAFLPHGKYTHSVHPI